ncbi:hypothetical protein LSAT2_027492 [Lamellibrachia satsuma]|nr:hypothetical protein LSAT2_027492 [Lamellibrachia satsuma]
MFNDYLRQLKTQLLAKARSDFWDYIITEKLALICSEESGDSKVTDREAEAFLAAASPSKESSQSTYSVADDPENLLDCL